MSDKNKGIYRKFEVKRTDGKSEPGKKHENCRYFVIDIDHDEFAFYALKQYALSCKKKYPVLSDDLEKICKELLKNDL